MASEKAKEVVPGEGSKSEVVKRSKTTNPLGKNKKDTKKDEKAEAEILRVFNL
jgi:hypothetical protein